MQVLSSIAEICTAAFIAGFLLNFFSWTRNGCPDALLHMPARKVARAVLYMGGLGGPIAFLIGVILSLPILKQFGLVATNLCLCYMNFAALIVRHRSKRN